MCRSGQRANSELNRNGHRHGWHPKGPITQRTRIVTNTRKLIKMPEGSNGDTDAVLDLDLRPRQHITAEQPQGVKAFTSVGQGLTELPLGADTLLPK